MSLGLAAPKVIHYLSPLGKRIKALPTGQLFHNSNARHRLVMGPFGSGKSLMMCQEIFRRASRQLPNENGVRRTRWAIVRNTYPMLKDTTMKTWLDWFPEAKYGKVKMAPPPEQHLTWDVEDKDGRVTKVECEILFRALDSADQVKNLLSLEITGAWFNEAREIPKALQQAMDGRIGRFPSKQDGGCTWCGVIYDTNPYDTDHYLYDLFEVQRLPGYEFYSQDGAENNENLPTNYYENISIGKDPEWVRMYVKGEHGFICEGKPVYPEFRHAIHVSPQGLAANPAATLYIGLDFGLTPAMVWTQIDAKGRWLILHEEVSDGFGIDRFSDHCIRVHNERFGGFSDCRYFADPAGTQRAQTDEKTCYQILAEKGIICEPGAIDFTARREAVAGRLGTLIGGDPAILVDGTHCKTLVKGFMGGYAYPEIGNSGRYGEKPEKNAYSHPHDALQYIGTNLFGSKRRGKRDKRKKRSWKTI